MARLLFMVVILAMPGMAHAVDLHQFTPPPGDISMSFLQQIFGSDSKGNLGSDSTMLSAMMYSLNSACLLLAMIFVAYTSYVGVLNSAHDGELLGRKMSEIWVPIRTTGGIGLLLPVKGGYCLLQVGIFWLITNGIGLADDMWNAGLSKLQQTGTMGEISVPDARPLAGNILKALVCQGALNKQYEAEGRQERIKLRKVDELPAEMAQYYQSQINTLAQFQATTEYRWESTTETIGPAKCGALAFNATPSANSSADAVTMMVRRSMAATEITAVANMMQQLQPVADAIVAGQMPKPGAIEQAALAYSNEISTAAKNALSAQGTTQANQSFIQHAKDSGWVMAGGWFNQLIKLQDTVQQAADVLPTSHLGQAENLEVSASLIGYHDAMAIVDQYALDRRAAPDAAYQDTLADAKSISSAEDVWRILSIPGVAAIRSITNSISGQNAVSPVLQLKDTGNAIITAGTTIKSAWFMMMGFAGSRLDSFTAGNIFNVSLAMGTLTGTIEFISNMLWGTGAMLAYALPFVPVFLFGTGVIRWIASVLEAVVAAPLMATFVIHPDGHETTGRAGPGMMLIFSCVMTPALLLLGFTLSTLALYPAVDLVNSLFLSTLTGATTGSFVGLISIIAYSSIYVVMMVMATHACYSLVHAVPDNVMKYIGAAAGAQGIGQSEVHKATTSLEGGASGSGGAMSRIGNIPSAERPKSEGAQYNGITNGDHLG